MKVVNNYIFVRTAFLFLPAVLLLLLTTSLALAQEGARVYLKPVESTEDTLTVEVMADNVTDMYGAEFRLRYDPTVVAVQDINTGQEGVQIEPGTLLPPDQGFVVANSVDETEGQVVFAMTLLNPAPAVSGSGPLARVTFQVLQATPSEIIVEHAKLVAVDLQTIPSETAVLAIGQESSENSNTGGAAPVDTVPPAGGESAFPWWIVAVIIIMLGVIVLGGFIIMGNARSSTAPIVQADTPRQPEQPVRVRPSAFNQQQISPDLNHKPQRPQ